MKLLTRHPITIEGTYKDLTVPILNLLTIWVRRKEAVTGLYKIIKMKKKQKQKKNVK